MRFFLTITVLFLLFGCGPSKNLVYLDDWEGNYVLNEHGCCGAFEKPVTLVISRQEQGTYNWYMLNGGVRFGEGRAVYEKNKLKFYATRVKEDKRYFSGEVRNDAVLFWMEYDNYYSDKVYKYIGCYTRWRNELVGYEQRNRIFAGVHYHFKKPGAGEIRWQKAESK
jgi:hypothetical protein